MKSDFSVIVLAAGFSSRMGVPKLSLKFNENKTFIEHIASEISKVNVTEIALVVNEEGSQFVKSTELRLPKNLNVVLNENPELDRFHSVKLGLQALDYKQNVILLNVDNPFIDISIVNVLIENREDYNLVCPAFNGKGGHPLLMSKKVADTIVHETETHHNLRDYLRQFNKKYIEVEDPKVLVNINTPEEYLRYFKIS